MDKQIFIVSIITLVVAVAMIILCVFLAVRQKKQMDNTTNQNTFDTKDLEKNQIQSATEIKMAVNNLEKNLSLKMEGELNAKMQGQITEIVKTMKEQSDADTKRLNDFQSSMSTNLNEQIKTMNQTINQRFSEITTKTNEQMSNMEKSMKGLMDSDTNRLNGFQKTIQENMTLQMNVMNQKIDASMKTINEKVNQSLSDGFKGTSESMISLQKQLGMVQEAQKNIENLQGEITSLKDVLSNNQQKGKYGEFQLEMLLDNLFQGSKGVLYDTQYILEPSRGDEPALKPDAVVFLDGEAHHQIVCIDSKFSLTGYEDLFDSSKHLTDSEIAQAKAAFKNATRLRIEETSKYIVKGKTISNALMFIPNDGVFAYIHNEFSDLLELAQKKHVVLVSPTILQPLLASFRVIQIDAKKSKNIALINQQLAALGKEFERFIPRWESLNSGIQSLTKKSESFSKTVEKIGTKFNKVANIEFDDEEKKAIGNDGSNDETKQIEMNEEETIG